MFKFFIPALILLGLTACVLAPQTIQLNEKVTLTQKELEVTRGALVRVVDQREVSREDLIGLRGGRDSEQSPLVAQAAITNILRERLRSSLEQLGYGASQSDTQPIKAQLDVQDFTYKCNDGVVVTQCQVSMKFLLTVIDATKTFTKPFGASETRRVAASPVAAYNQEWVNKVLDQTWQRIFSDQELIDFLKE